MVVGKSTRWLMDNGRLSDFRYFAGKVKPDLSKVPLSNGDYAQKKLADFMEHQGAIIGDCVSDYRERCEGTRHIVRCCSIAHSQKVAQAFRDVGYAFVHVDGTTPADERKRIFKAYASGEVLGLCYAELLNFGFDLAQAAGVPDVCIESASDLRPTKSLAGIMQFWGRALRKKDKPAVIIDRVNNFVEHGFPDSERDWDLSDRKQSKKVERNAEYVRQCPKCYEVHRPQPRCPACEYLYTPEERKIDEYEGETEELDRQMREQMKEALRLQARREQGMARDYPSLYALGVKRGYSNPSAWAYQVLANRRQRGRS